MKLYADTHIPKQVAIQLRQNGIDVVRCEELGMAEASDEQHWQYAQTYERTILTHDDDFLTLASESWSAGKKFFGIIYGNQKVQGKIGLIVRTCLMLKGKDLTNQVIYINVN